MRHNHRDQVFCLYIETKELCDFEHSVSDSGLLIQDKFVADLSENFLSIRLDLVFNADNEVVKLVERLLLEVGLEGVLLEISENI